MIKWLRNSIAVAVGMSVSLVACAPKATPTPPARTAAPSATAVSTAPVSTPANQADVAWQQVEQAARKEGRLIVYDVSSFSGDLGRAVTKAFKEKYGITVEFLVTGSSSASMERLQTEKRMGQVVSSLSTSGSVGGPRLLSLGVVQNMSHELPVLRDRSVFSMDPLYSPDGELLTYNYTMYAAGVNTKLVKEGEIQSFKDLLDPKWKSKMVMRDPRLGSGPEMLTITTMRHEKILDDDYFYKLAQQKPLLWGGSNQEAGRMVARGESLVGFYTSLTAVWAPIIKEGGPVRLVHFKEGSIGMPNTIQLAKDAPHANAAKLFANWLLSAEGQRLYHGAAATPSIRKDVPDFTLPELKKDPVKKLIPTSWQVALKTIDEVNDGVMDKFFGKR